MTCLDRGRISSSPSDPRLRSGKSRTSRWERTITKRRAASIMVVDVVTLRKDISRFSFAPHMRQPGVRIVPFLFDVYFILFHTLSETVPGSSSHTFTIRILRKHSRHGRWNVSLPTILVSPSLFPLLSFPHPETLIFQLSNTTTHGLFRRRTHQPGCATGWRCGRFSFLGYHTHPVSCLGNIPRWLQGFCEASGI